MKRIVVASVLVVFLLGLVLLIQEREREARQGSTVFLPLTLGASGAEGGAAELQWHLPRGIRNAILREARRTSGELLLAVDGQGIASVLRFAREGEELSPKVRLLHYELRNGVVTLGSAVFFLPVGAEGQLAQVAFGELMVMAGGDAVLIALCAGDRERIDFPVAAP